MNRLYEDKAVYEKRKLFQTRLSKHISCDYLNLSLANEYVGDFTIPTQVIKYIQNALQADQPIILQYSNQITLYKYAWIYFVYWRYYLRPIWWTSKSKKMVVLSGSINSTYLLNILMRYFKILADYCLRHLVENVPIHMITLEWG